MAQATVTDLPQRTARPDAGYGALDGLISVRRHLETKRRDLLHELGSLDRDLEHLDRAIATVRGED
ncbi:hypothetical protein [Nocardioides pakistanensis]